MYSYTLYDKHLIIGLGLTSNHRINSTWYSSTEI